MTSELSHKQYREYLEYITTHLKVGKYIYNDSDEKNSSQKNISLTHLHSSRTLACLLGLRATILQKGPVLQPAELQCKNLLKSPIFTGGLQLLQPANPFDEEKGEARSSASTAGSTPTEASCQIPTSELMQPVIGPHMVWVMHGNFPKM